MQKILLAMSIVLATTLSSCKTAGDGSALKSDVSVPYGSYRFDEVTWLTTHNAFNNNKDAFWAAPNQGQSIQKQLEDGVRGFMVDLHPTPDKQNAMLCHNLCDKDIAVLQQNLVKFLTTVVKFMNQHHEAIVTIFFEDYSTKEQLQKALNAVSGLNDLVFNPYNEDVRGKGWPKLQEMVDRNKRLLMISDHSDKQDLGVAFAKDFTAENYWSLGTLGKDYSCKSRWDNIALNQRDSGFERLFVMNHFRDVPTRVLAGYDNGYLKTRIEDYCLNQSNRKPNFVAVDFYDWGGAKGFVEKMNQVRGILYKDSDYTGDAQLLYPEDKLKAKQIKIGQDQVTSIRVYPNAKIVLFNDDNFKNFLIDVTTSVKNLGDNNDKVSSLRVERQ